MFFSHFRQKLKNSGHTVSSSKYILVHGVVKYTELARLSKLPLGHSEYRPLHCPKEFDVFRRKLVKMLANTGWYEDNLISKKVGWRENLPLAWVGNKPVQHSVKGMRFSTLFMVPSRKGGRL